MLSGRRRDSCYTERSTSFAVTVEKCGFFCGTSSGGIERARILDIEGDLVTLRYETEEDDEICSWEEMIRLESIGSVMQRLAAVPRGEFDFPLAEECPETERLEDRSSEPNAE